MSNQNKIYQLTYKENEIIVWNLTKGKGDSGSPSYVASIEEVRSMPEGNQLKQGWGLAYKYDEDLKKDVLLACDGSDKIYVIDIQHWK